MNTLYNLALRQSSSIQSDLTLMESTPNHSPSFTSLSGQLSASLSAFSRTVDDYENMAKRELHIQKRERALQRVGKFRQEEREMRMASSDIKNRSSDPSSASSSASAFASASRSNTAGNTESPFSLHARAPTQSHQQMKGMNGATTTISLGAHPPQDRPDPLSAYRMNASAAAMFGEGGEGTTREGYALREHSFVQQTENQLDGFIAQGREVWSNLTEQRDILKSTQRRLRDVGVTMGLSRDVIGYIERRSTQDNIIFGAGAIFTLVCFYYIYKWFG